jgi:NAD(P)-dependent dehydrogenase (short-subunit alcohol dehydrogenase family)
MGQRFAEKSVIVTGAANGIGLAYAEAFAVEGASVVDQFGGVDVLVNNAGLRMGRYNLTSTLELDEWRRLFDVNVFGAQVQPQDRH